MTQGNWPGGWQAQDGQRQSRPWTQPPPQQWSGPSGQRWNQPPSQFNQPPGQWQGGYRQPGWQQGFPPPRPPRRSGGLGKTLITLVAVGFILVVAVNIFRAAGEMIGSLPQAIEPSGWASPKPEPVSPEPVSPEPVDPAPLDPDPGAVNPNLPPRQWDDLPPADSTDPDWAALQQSPLYAQPLPSLKGCPAAELATTMDDVERLAGGQLDCLQAAYKPVLAALGYSSEDIPVYYYEGGNVDTPCGNVTAPAVYCSAQGGAIYFGETALNGASWMDFGIKDVAGHEYGHHLQAQAGMFEAEYRVGNGNESSRRIELQATCWAYASLAHDASYDVGPHLMEDYETYLRATIDDGIHGSPDSLAYWGLRGLYSADLGNCNTWTASPADVD